jgi:glutathione S-transferase
MGTPQPELQLYVADYNYSSWSMRAGIVLRALGVPFQETLIHLDDAGKAELRKVSASGLLPLLVHGTLRVGDSLAIAEYLAERFPEAQLWPADAEVRALARAASCEMHSGFGAMRNSLSMNIRARYPGFARSPEVERDVQRVQALWRELRGRFAARGEFLCGGFGIVDAMFAPVVMRFRSYDVGLSGACAEYSEALLQHPAVRGWLEKAAEDDFRVPAYEYSVG